MSTSASLLCTLLAIVGYANGIYPVIMIPGDGGSRIEARLNKTWVPHYFCYKKADWFELWLNVHYLAPEAIDCWADNMRLRYDNKSRTTHDNEGVEIRVPGWGKPKYVEYLDSAEDTTGLYFGKIADKLVKTGYVRGRNLFGAPYDFRKAANELNPFFSNLTTLAEFAYKSNGNTPVVILTHSMGSVAAHYWLTHKVDQAWKDKHIRALVSLAGPWAGTVRSLKVFAFGDDLGSFWVNTKSLGTQERSNPSLMWLMPSPLLWPAASDVLLQAADVNITTANMKDFFYTFGRPDGWEMYKDIKDLSVKMEAPNVDVFCLHGSGVPTTDKIVYTSNFTANAKAKLMKGEGDGTVNMRSLSACTKWETEMSGRHKFQHHVFNNTEHLQILRDEAPSEYVKDLISNLNEELRMSEPVIFFAP